MRLLEGLAILVLHIAYNLQAVLLPALKVNQFELAACFFVALSWSSL